MKRISKQGNKAMNVELAALADYVNISREGKLNILGIFQEISPPVLPFALPQMYLVAVYNASPAEVGMEKNIRIILIDADANSILDIQQSVTVPQPKWPGSKVILNQVTGLAGVKFEKPGDYQFSVLVGEDEKHSIPFRVNEVPKRGDDV